MKKSPPITSVESKAIFREKLLVKFVQQNLPARNPRGNKISGLGPFSNLYKEFESCAAETPVIGSLEIEFTKTYFNLVRKISIPVSSRFFIFFTRNDEQPEYNVSWSSSLS